MTTTWASSTHIRHPWFDTVVMKRKHRDTVSPDDELPSSCLPSSTSGSARAAAAPPPKRRRCSELEHGFAHLSLSLGNNTSSANSTVPVQTQGSTNTQSTNYYYPAPAAPTASPSPSSSTSSDPFPRIQDVTPVSMDAEPLCPTSSFPAPYQLAYTVEEPRIPEVKMKTSSWYEPEPDRIVITDMDSFTQSDDESDDIANVNATINPVLLDRIRASSSHSSRPSLPPTTTTTTSPPNNTRAVVLFKPLPLGDSGLERIEEAQAKQEREAVEGKRAEFKVKSRYTEAEKDDDAMDVEP